MSLRLAAVFENPFAVPAAFPDVPSASPGGGRVAALRTAATLLLAGLVGGLVVGLLWTWITPSVVLVVRADGAYPDPSAQDRWFSADGWFLVLGAVLGTLLAVLAWWRGRSHPVGALLGVFLGGLLAAVTAWWVGGLVGPADPSILLDGAAIGTRFEQSLGLRAMAVLLAPAVAGVATFVACAAAAPPQEPSERLAA